MKAPESSTAASRAAQVQRKAAGSFFKKGEGAFFGKNDQPAFFEQAASSTKQAAVQTRLSVGAPGDTYEKEADSMADKVVQRLSEPHSVQAKAIAPVGAITPLVQTKCAACEKEEQLQKKEEEQEPLRRKPIFESEAKPFAEEHVQRKCAACEKEEHLQKKAILPQRVSYTPPVSGSGDTTVQRCAACEKEEKLQKSEEDAMQEEPLQRKPVFEDKLPGLQKLAIQRKCAACEAKEKEEKGIQRKSFNSSAVSSGSVEQTLNTSKGGGAALPGSLRSNMESAFGSDFSGVRIHTDSRAIQMSTDLRAHAFTHGNDIYFNQGKYDTQTAAGKHLLAHELTHVVQQGFAPRVPQVQRSPWDDFVDTVSDAADATGEALSNAGHAVADTASAAGSAIYNAGQTAYNYGAAGVHAAGDALASAGETIYNYGAAGVEALGEAATAAADWLASEAGAALKSFVALFGGSISISSAGLEITLPRMCPIDAMPFSRKLKTMQKKFMVPVLRLPIAPGIFVTGQVGLTGSLQPEIQLQLGPFCLNGGHILINPLTSSYSISGSVSFTGAAALGAELRGGVRGELGLDGVVVVGGVPIPIKIPLLGVEGGLAGLVRGIGAGTYELGGSLMYSGGTITATSAQRLDIGLAGDLYAGAYAQLDVLGKNLCRIYWQPYEWHGGIAGSIGLSADLAITTGGFPSISLGLDAPSFDSIPFDQIPLAISREGFSDDCPIKDKICELLDALGLLPSKNGGSWDWAATGHGGTYGPGARLGGPLDVYQRDPKITSGSTCRGACGPNCDTCEHHATYSYVDPVSGETWQYTNFEDCNSNDGCREHDAAFDWAADKKGETGKWAIIMPWHMAANIECTCHNLAGNCMAWIAGLPPYDMKMFFADTAVKVSSTAPPSLPPVGPGVTHSSQPIGEWGPDFYHYSAKPPSGNFKAGGERWTDYHTNCRAEAQAATGVGDAFSYISVLSDKVADKYLNRGQFTPKTFTSVIHGILVTVYHYRTHTEIPANEYTTTTLDLFTPNCSAGASSSNVPPGGSEEEKQLDQCDKGELPREQCDELYDRVIRRFGNNERDLNINPDNASEDRIREDDAPISSTFRRMYNRLDSWDIYMYNKHPDWYQDFDSLFGVKKKKTEWQKELKDKTKEYKLGFRDVRNKDRAVNDLQEKFRREILQDMENRINTLNRQIAGWYKIKTGSDEDIDTIIERVHREGTEMWRAAWRQAILAVNRILSRLWPPAKARIIDWVAAQRKAYPGKDLGGTVGELDYVGSLATGVKGAPKQFSRFNPDKFDVDANVEAPPLEKFAINIRHISPDKGRIFALGQQTGITPLEQFCKQTQQELLSVKGYNDDEKDVFDVVIKSSETPSQQRSSNATARIYALRNNPSFGEARYNQMIKDLRTAGLVTPVEETVNGKKISSWQVKNDLTNTEEVQFNAIVSRYENP